jgi:hypothetical protein
VNLLASLVVGALLGVVEAATRSRLGAAPQLAALALALLLVAPRTASTGARCLGILLGYSSCSLDPVGVFLLGGGLAALLLVPARRFVFAESAATQALFGLGAAASLAAARGIHALLGLSPPLPWGADALVTPLLTAASVPILAHAGLALRRRAAVVEAARDGGRAEQRPGEPRREADPPPPE